MVQYKCDRCGKLFKHKNDYRRHLNRKTPCALKIPLMFQCSMCNKTFNKIYNLKRHEQHSCEARRDPFLRAPKSTKKSKSRRIQKVNKVNTTSEQSEHKKSNNFEKLDDNNKYICKGCGKGFTTKTSMYRHIRKYCKKKKDKIKKLEEEIHRLKNDQSEDVEKIKNINNNNYNTYYIHAHFKDAYNLDELMKPPLTNSEEEYIDTWGGVNGCIEIFKRRCITGIEIEKRPVHCPDESRNKFMIHNENKWDIDGKGDVLLKNIYNKIRETYSQQDIKNDIKNDPEKYFNRWQKLRNMEKPKNKRIILHSIKKLISKV